MWWKSSGLPLEGTISKTLAACPDERVPEMLEVIERVSNGEAVLSDDDVAEAAVVEYAPDDPKRPFDDEDGAS
jgi:hypothetical protein